MSVKLFVGGLLLVLLLRLAWPWLMPNLTQPQAILVLGGSPQREIFAADFAIQKPKLSVWVTGGSNREYAEAVFLEHGVSLDRVHLDYRAVDTVTNFTTLVQDLEQASIRSVYLVTGNYHMRRATWIGRIVLGSRGIRIIPLPIATTMPDEPISKVLRDTSRSLLWLVSGRTGAAFGKVIREQRRAAASGLAT